MKNLLVLRERELRELISIDDDFRRLESEGENNLKLLKQVEDEVLRVYYIDYQSCPENFYASLKALKKGLGSQVENQRIRKNYDFIEQVFICKEKIFQERNEAIEKLRGEMLTFGQNQTLQKNLQSQLDNFSDEPRLTFNNVRSEIKIKNEDKLLEATKLRNAKKAAWSKKTAINPQDFQDHLDNMKQVHAYIDDGQTIFWDNHQDILHCLENREFTFHPAKNARSYSHKMTFLEMISECFQPILLSEDINMKNKRELIESFKKNLKQFVKTAGDEMLEELKIPKFTKLLLEQEYTKMFEEFLSYNLNNMSIYEISSLYSIGKYFAISSPSYKTIHEFILLRHIGKCIFDTREKPGSKSAFIIIADSGPHPASFFQHQYDSFKEEKLFDAYILLGSGELRLDSVQAVSKLKEMAGNLKDFDKIIMQIWSHNREEETKLTPYIEALQEVFLESKATIIAEIYACHSGLYHGIGLITRENFFLITTASADGYFYGYDYDLIDYIACLKDGSGPVEYFASKCRDLRSTMISSQDIEASTFDDYLGFVAKSIDWFI